MWGTRRNVRLGRTAALLALWLVLVWAVDGYRVSVMTCQEQDGVSIIETSKCPGLGLEKEKGISND